MSFRRKIQGITDMPKLLAVVGGLIICAGIDLLWQSRNQIRFWVEEYGKFVLEAWRRPSSLRGEASMDAFLSRRASVEVILGFGLALIVGPVMLAVSLTLLLYPR
jgi:hypothetical protein